MEVVKLLVSERADAKREGDHCTGLDWTGLVWTGLDRTGLDWTGLGLVTGLRTGLV